MNASPPPRTFIHANALIVGETGLLLRGPSGAGKSALTLELLSLARQQGDFARLIGDDRVSLEANGGRLIARPHPKIAGMIEARGLGILHQPYEAGGVIHAIVDLTPDAAAHERLPELATQSATLLDISLPRRCIPARDPRAGVAIINFIQSLMQN